MHYSEKIISSHKVSLSGHYNDKLNSYKFEEPAVVEKELDSVISVSPSKKIAFITRHLLTTEPTHILILENEYYERR